MLIGYARASILDQNLDLQRDALKGAGCGELFEEKKSGKAGTTRPEFSRILYGGCDLEALSVDAYELAILGAD
ncbi:hypothetical protein FV223_15335 [Methylobacterium sp. WL116]|nr:hypothetical protein FV223_15335 [Methylobacterium sp. WL116]